MAEAKIVSGLVSILTPAYNMQAYIHRLLDSVLKQTYPSVEMMVINDGSTDDTPNIVKKYMPLFQQKGYRLLLKNQENCGQAATVNSGLKYIRGEYFTWPDADDWYADKYSIEKMVLAFRQYGEDVGAVRCAYKNMSEDMKCLSITIPHQDVNPKNIFDDAVRRTRNFRIEPGGWMLKTELLDTYIPKREIFTTRLSGQNAQILWPYLFHSGCVALEEPLFCYLVRKESHSRNMFKTYALKKRQREDGTRTFEAVLNSIEDMPNDTRKAYLQLVKSAALKSHFQLASQFKEAKEVRHYYHELEKMTGITTTKEKRTYVLSYLPFGLELAKILNKIKL